MKTKQKLRSYTITANLYVTMECSVRATDLEDASRQAKELEISNFIDSPLVDCRKPEIVSIYLDDSNLPNEKT